MCSRFLPLAVAIAAVVACGRSTAAASDDKSTGPTVNNESFIRLSEYTSTPPVATGVTITDSDSGIVYDGPNYKTEICWEAGLVSFCNMLVSAAGGASPTLPIMAGDAWSSPERKAGIYFMESIPGIGLHIIKCNGPENMVKGASTVSCEWADMYGYRSFRMTMDEGSVTITGFDPSSGNPIDNWFLSLITAREKGNDLPFTVIVPEKVNSEVNGREYHVGIGPGKASLNRDDTPPVFNIYPENGTITLSFGK